MRQFTRFLVALAACILLTGCASLSSLSPFAFPRPWDYTRTKPAESNLSGVYKIHQVRNEKTGNASNVIESFRSRQDISVKLNPDHTAFLSNIPQLDGFGDSLICSFSGPAKWYLSKDGAWEIRFDADYPAGSVEIKSGACGSQWDDGVTILGQAAPYRLWLVFGDPDDDTGIEFAPDGRSKNVDAR
jgi:hypothetical protein